MHHVIHVIRFIATSSTLVVALFMTLAATALNAQGAYFRALQSGNAYTLSYPTAWMAKTYIWGTLTELERACNAPPISASEKSEAVASAAAVVMRPKHRDAAFYYLGYANNMAAWTEANVSDADMKAYLNSTSCAAAVRTWTPIARNALRDIRIGARVDSLAMAGCRNFADGGALMDCSCFSEWFNRESTPVVRQHLVNIADTLAAFHAAMRNVEFYARVEMRCPMMPKFAAKRFAANELRSDQVTAVDHRMRTFSTTLDASTRTRAYRESSAFLVKWSMANQRRNLVMHRCDYGPASSTYAAADHQPSSRYFWSAKHGGPTQAELTSGLSGSPFLPIVLDIARVQLDACPQTLSEADSLKAGPPQAIRAGGTTDNPASGANPGASNRGVRTPTAPVTPRTSPPAAPPGETAVERSKRMACERKQMTITRFREMVLRNPAQAKSLARLEAEYLAQCGKPAS